VGTKDKENNKEIRKECERINPYGERSFDEGETITRV